MPGLYLDEKGITVESDPVADFPLFRVGGWVVMELYNFGDVQRYDLGHHESIAKVATDISD